jgi:hypothetical protein
VIKHQSTNICFKNVLGFADILTDQALNGYKKKDWLDWTLWGIFELGSLLLFGGKALYMCLANDANFGWATPTAKPNGEIISLLLNPWMVDYAFSIVGVVTGVKTGI